MNRTKQITLGVAIATFLLTALRPARAQFMNPYTWSTWNNPISSSADTAIMNRAFQRMVGVDSSGSVFVPPETPVTTAIPLTATSFSPVAPQLMPQQLASDPTLSATEQQQAAQLYSELLTSYTDLLNQQGEQRLKHNVAGAMMYLLLSSNYVLSNGEELSEAQQEELLQRFNATLAEDLGFVSLSAQGKQELYETLVISASLPLVLYLEGQQAGDRSLVEQAQDLAQATLTAILGTD